MRFPPRDRPLTARPGSLFVAALVLLFGCSSWPSEGKFDGQPLSDDVRIDRLVAYKDAGVMEAWSGEELVKVYTIAVGWGGSGPKRYEGDQKTPEGTYRIDSRHRSEKYYRFLHVSYPNQADREAYRRGLEEQTIPPDVGAGGAIGIHGEKVGYEGWPHKWVDWTAGCIAVDNDEIEELYRAFVDDAVIFIEP